MTNHPNRSQPARKIAVMFESDKARDALAFDPLPKSRWVTVDDRGIAISVWYAEDVNRLIKSLPGATWNNDQRRWRVPFTSAEALRASWPRLHEMADTEDTIRVRRNDDLKRDRAARAAEWEAEAAARAKQRDAERQARLDKRRADESEAALCVLGSGQIKRKSGRPIHVLALECIGHDATKLGPYGSLPPRAYVRQIVGFDGRWIGAKVIGRTDYRDANCVGSRGVRIYFDLYEGPIYEIHAPITWRQTDKYFAEIIDGEIRRMPEEEVAAWLER